MHAGAKMGPLSRCVAEAVGCGTAVCVALRCGARCPRLNLTLDQTLKSFAAGHGQPSR